MDKRIKLIKHQNNYQLLMEKDAVFSPDHGIIWLYNSEVILKFIQQGTNTGN
jgi:hypothetical protein